MQIVTATEAHIEQVADLFDQYRQFYDRQPDRELAERFIAARIRNGESTVFVAFDETAAAAAGFVQLYPSFCSVQAIRILILYDLYVHSAYRRQGIGEALMNRATEFAGECRAARIDLLTAKTNQPGQTLYEKLGYRKVHEEFFAYSLSVPAAE